MNNATKLALATAALVAVAFVGLRFLVPGEGIGGPDPTSTASPIASQIPMPAGALDPGTYLVREGAFTRRDFTVTVPEGWSHDTNYVSNGDAFGGTGVAFATWIVSHVYADSCQWEGTLREVGSAAELADALAQQTGHQTSGPIDVIIGQEVATRLEFSVAADFDVSACDSEFTRLWPDAGPDENYGLPIFVGQTTTVYVVDLDGEPPMLVIAMHTEDSSAADVAELDQVVDSIRFQP